LKHEEGSARKAGKILDAVFWSLGAGKVKSGKRGKSETEDPSARSGLSAEVRGRGSA